MIHHIASEVENEKLMVQQKTANEIETPPDQHQYHKDRRKAIQQRPKHWIAWNSIDTTSI